MRKNIIIGVSVILLSLSGIILCNNKKTDKDLPIYYSHAAYMYDTSTPEKAIGISENVIVARIDRVKDTVYKHPIEIVKDNKTKIVYTPYTIYEITVIENIKGSIKVNEKIDFMQYGGLNYDKKSYTLLDDSPLLTVGNYYILMPSWWEENSERILEVSEKTRMIDLGQTLSTSAYNTLDRYRVAYTNQYVPEKLITE